MTSIFPFILTENFMRTLLITLATTAAFALPAMAGHHKSYEQKADIVDTAASNDNFDTLVAAVKAAGLVETLKGDGPFTVFAPTDQAFAKLPHGTVENLLKPENKAQLQAILTYHVVPGKILAADLAGKTLSTKTAQGTDVAIDGTDGVRVETAQVIQADLEVANGVIHVIDRVILPQS